ncbi:unnamed protein product [Durusdinium trenchii]|uniref:Uncharacterized protein n=1 Tax=Durusdinium trenchii TaxID=1381693 RepID=A0ABP0MCE7_9DINO
MVQTICHGQELYCAQMPQLKSDRAVTWNQKCRPFLLCAACMSVLTLQNDATCRKSAECRRNKGSSSPSWNFVASCRCELSRQFFEESLIGLECGETLQARLLPL